MADNVDITPGSGATVAADDISGVLHQRVKPTWGVDGTATDVAFGAGMPVQGDYAEVSGSVTSATSVIASTDVRPYGWVSVQITAAGTGTVTFQGSNDGATWRTALLLDVAAGVSIAPVGTATAVGHFHGPVRWRYFRAQVTAYTSGTFTAVAEFTSAPSQWGVVPVTVGNAPYVTISGTTQVRPEQQTGASDLSSVARSATANGSAVNGAAAGQRGTVYQVTVTAVTGGTLDLKLQGTMDTTNWFDIPGAVWATVTTTGAYEMGVFPGITPVTNRRVSDILPRQYRLAYTIGGGGTFTFSSAYTHLT